MAHLVRTVHEDQDQSRTKLLSSFLFITACFRQTIYQLIDIELFKMLNTIELCTKLKEKHISLLLFNTTYTKRRSMRPRKAFASMFLIWFPCKNLQITIQRESNHFMRFQGKVKGIRTHHLNVKVIYIY